MIDLLSWDNMTNMVEAATTSPAVRSPNVDLLVPPPGPGWRRALAWVAFLAVVGAVGWLWATGTATPRLGSQGGSWGGEGPVHLGVDVANRSRVAVEIVNGPAPREGLELLGYQVVEPDDTSPSPVVADPFPLRIEPGASVHLMMVYAVTDCAEVAGEVDDDQIDLGARIAEGPFTGRTRTVEVDAPGFVESGQPESWPATTTEHACP